MGLGLLAPAGLAALAALLLPLLLHLARRTPQRRTEFAALRWLAARLRPRRRLRIEDPWLLLLRLLLVACVALLFAQPVHRERLDGQDWVLVHPAVALADAERAFDCKRGECDWRWLAPGFPSIDEARPPPTPPLASLLREADARLPGAARLRVASPRELSGLDAERPRLSRAVEWRVLPAPSAAPAASAAAPPIAIVLRGSQTSAGRRYLRAAARAQGWRVIEEATGGRPPAGTTAVFQLDATPLSADLSEWVRAGGTLWLAAGATRPEALASADAWRAEDGTPVASRATLGRGAIWQWQAPLQPGAMPLLLDPAFPRGLAEALAPPAPPPSSALADAWQPRRGEVARLEARARPLDAWLAGLALLLFGAERWFATRRPRSASA